MVVRQNKGQGHGTVGDISNESAFNRFINLQLHKGFSGYLSTSVLVHMEMEATVSAKFFFLIV